jgi:hypothetical protein
LLQMAGRNDDHELYVKLHSVVSSCNPLCWFLFYIRSVGVTLSNWDLPPPEIMYFHRSLFSGTRFIINGLCSSVPTLSFPSLLSLLIPNQNWPINININEQEIQGVNDLLLSGE